VSNVDVMLQAALKVEEFVIAGTAFLGAQIVELNNVGGDGAPPAPKDTGNLRGSVRLTVGTPSAEEGVARPARGGSYPLTTEKDVRRAMQLGGFSIGDTLWERWIAPYASIIEAGRTVDKNGRPIGSEQAPEGWVNKGIDVALARLANWKWDGDEA
jgi:hypothetical protein